MQHTFGSRKTFFLIFTDGLKIFVKITSIILCGITGTLFPKILLVTPKSCRKYISKRNFVVILGKIGKKSTSKTQTGLQIKKRIAQNEFWGPGLVLGLRSR